MLDILIMNSISVTMEGPGTGIILNGAVGIENEKIAVVGDTDEIGKKYRAQRYIDGRGKVVIPGLINVHLHSSDGIGRGVSQDVDDWLYNIWPILLNADDESVKLGSMLGLMEMVKSGTTTVCDMSNGANLIAENFINIGIRAVLSEMIHEMPKSIIEMDPFDLYDYDHFVGNKKFNDNIKLIEKYHGASDGLITCEFGPQAVDMISMELLKEVFNEASKLDVKIHMHVAQDRREDIIAERRYGKRTIPLLEEKGLLSDRIKAAHMTDATANELQRVAKAGCSMVLCPNSVPLAGGQLPRGEEFMEYGGKIGLGTDTVASNNCCNMFNEMKYCSVMNKVKKQSSTAMPAWKALRLATIEGAAAIGMENSIGSIKEGKYADVVIVDFNQPALTPLSEGPIRNIIPNLVYSANGSEVETVIINGKIVVDNKTLISVDEKMVINKIKVAVVELQKKIEKIPEIQQLEVVKLTREGNY